MMASGVATISVATFSNFRFDYPCVGDGRSPAGLGSGIAPRLANFPIDHDDGSQYYNDTANFMVWGGCKNFRGHSKSCDHNLIAYPGTGERSAGNRRCQTDDNGIFADQYYHGNDCLTGDGQAYSFGHCKRDSLGTTVYETANNTFYAPDATFVENCEGNMNLTQWQALGQDDGSNVKALLSETELIQMARKKLGDSVIARDLLV